MSIFIMFATTLAKLKLKDVETSIKKLYKHLN